MTARRNVPKEISAAFIFRYEPLPASPLTLSEWRESVAQLILISSIPLFLYHPGKVVLLGRPFGQLTTHVPNTLPIFCRVR
jgi:hypothetical protein